MAEKITELICNASTVSRSELLELFLELEKATKDSGIKTEWVDAANWPFLKRGLETLVTYREVPPAPDERRQRKELVREIAETLFFAPWFVYGAPVDGIDAAWINRRRENIRKNSDPEKDRLFQHYTGLPADSVCDFLLDTAKGAIELNSYPGDYMRANFSKWTKNNPELSDLIELIGSVAATFIVRKSMRLKRRAFINDMTAKSYMARLGIHSLICVEGALALKNRLSPFI